VYGEINQVPSNILQPKLQLVAWEITRSCNLTCAHCRAAAVDNKYPGEFSLKECYRIVDEIREVGNPILILTGGEPLARTDVAEIGKYAVGRGFRVVMGTNGTLITPEITSALKNVPLSRIAVSLDFPTAELQDRFRGKEGAYAAALSGIACAREAGIEVQINSTITKLNVSYLNHLIDLALQLGAVAFHPFLLVPTGRGKGLESVELSPQEYEDTLSWIFDKQKEVGDKLFFKPTDAPHYMRVMRQKQHGQTSQVAASGHHGGHPANAMTRGCLAGTGFCFISHVGKVQGCGYLTAEAGDLKKESFGQIWNESKLFRDLRDLSLIKGKCGDCEYKRICGGCRARAYERTGDYLESEPYCIYQPKMKAMHA